MTSRVCNSVANGQPNSLKFTASIPPISSIPSLTISRNYGKFSECGIVRNWTLSVLQSALGNSECSLVAEMHPDKTGEELTERQHQFMEAFEVLKDFENFQLALKELRLEKSYRKTEENTGKRDEANQKKILERLQTKISEGDQLSKQLR